MQRIYKNYSKKNNIILFLTVFILFGYKEIVWPIFSIPVSYEMYVLIYLASVNYFIKSYINVIRISIIGLILSFFVLNGYNDLINKSLFRFIILIISFVCLDIIVSKVNIETYEKNILYFSSLFIIFSILSFDGNTEGRFRGFGANSIVIGIYSGLVLVFSNHFKNKYIKVLLTLLVIYAGFISGSRTFYLFLAIYAIFNLKDIIKYSPILFIYITYNQSVVNRMLDRLYSTELQGNSRTGIMKQFFDSYDITLFGNGLNTTSHLNNDGGAHGYFDMPAVIHVLNDFGIVPLILFSILFFVVMVYLYRRGDNNSMKMMLVFAALSIVSSNPVTPANSGFYLVWMGIFSIMNKYEYIFHQKPLNKTTGTI
jgi:hypothetical protein